MTLVCAGPSKDHLLLKVSSSTGWKQMSEENYKHIGDRFAQVFLVSVQLQPRSFQAQNNAFMLIAFSGTQRKRGGTWSNLFYYILEPSELLAPTTSFLAPKAQGIFYLSIFFVEKEKFLFLAGSFICSPWFLVLKLVLVLPVLVRKILVVLFRSQFYSSGHPCSVLFPFHLQHFWATGSRSAQYMEA